MPSINDFESKLSECLDMTSKLGTQLRLMNKHAMDLKTPRSVVSASILSLSRALDCLTKASIEIALGTCCIPLNPKSDEVPDSSRTEASKYP